MEDGAMFSSFFGHTHLSFQSALQARSHHRAQTTEQLLTTDDKHSHLGRKIDKTFVETHVTCPQRGNNAYNSNIRVVFKVQHVERFLLKMPNRTLLFDVDGIRRYPTGLKDVLQHLLEDGDFVVLKNGSMDIGSSYLYSTYFAFLCSSF
jgi:hypothetical protein